MESNQAPHAIDATLRLRLLDGAEILRHRRDLTHCLIPHRYEKGINAILPIVSLGLRRKWAPTPRKVLEEARDGPTAPDSVIAAEFDIPYSGLLGWLGVVWYFGIYWLWISTYLGFQDAL